jgi:hypothetical protein
MSSFKQIIPLKGHHPSGFQFLELALNFVRTDGVTQYMALVEDDEHLVDIILDHGDDTGFVWSVYGFSDTDLTRHLEDFPTKAHAMEYVEATFDLCVDDRPTRLDFELAIQRAFDGARTEREVRRIRKVQEFIASYMHDYPSDYPEDFI